MGVHFGHPDMVSQENFRFLKIQDGGRQKRKKIVISYKPLDRF